MEAEVTDPPVRGGMSVPTNEPDDAPAERLEGASGVGGPDPGCRGLLLARPAEVRAPIVHQTARRSKRVDLL